MTSSPSNNAQQDRILSIVGLALMIPVIAMIYIYATSGNPDASNRILMLLGGVVTIGLYSVLYRENPIYRMIEHIFIGLGVGYSLMVAWTEVLSTKWFDPIFRDGQWLWLWMIPLAIMAYFVFSKKHGWISRIPLGILIGFGAGQIFQAFWQQYSRQISNSFKPIVPNTFQFSSAFTAPPAANVITLDRALSNLVFIITLLSVLTYFLFAFEQKNKGVRNFAQLGRWLIMIGFGAIFGSTMMTRFALLVDRMYFMLIEWLRLGPA